MTLGKAEEALQHVADVPIPDDNDVLALNAKANEGKGSKELSSKSFNDAEHTAFAHSDARQLVAWHDK